VDLFSVFSGKSLSRVMLLKLYLQLCIVILSELMSFWVL